MNSRIDPLMAILIILGWGIASLLYRILVIGHLEQTAMLFIGLPTFLAIFVAIIPRGRSYTATIMQIMTKGTFFNVNQFMKIIPFQFRFLGMPSIKMFLNLFHSHPRQQGCPFVQKFVAVFWCKYLLKDFFCLQLYSETELIYLILLAKFL